MNYLKIKRAYAEQSENDGYRILVDRLWPRGISKEKINIDLWAKGITEEYNHAIVLKEWLEEKLL